MSDNPSGMPAAADNPMAAQQPPAPVASTEGVDVAAVEEAMNGANSEKSLERLNRFMTVRTWHDEPPESRT